MATIILAGGLSVRMGRDKASLTFGDSTLISTLVSRFESKCGPLVVVTRRETNLALERVAVVSDIFPEKGPLGGLHAGLLASPDENNFVVACDMPFADPAVALYLLDRLDGHDAVVPVMSGKSEPLHAVYRKSCLSQIEANLRDGNLRMRDLLDRVDTLYVDAEELRVIDPDLRCFVNINTPEELATIDMSCRLEEQEL